jgi:asparagine synthase (glutamine-hydrolysing)
MSVQFGRWSFQGRPSRPCDFQTVSSALVPYGPDAGHSFSDGPATILYRAFHTTKESRTEIQPHISVSGAVFTWDGRLDNREELAVQLADPLRDDCSDVSIVAAAYERWGIDSLARLIGDWALSVWRPRERSLVLAKDPIGTRHLYFWLEKDQITWSTVLDPLVLAADKSLQLDEEYIAGWLSFFPAAHLTPYAGIYQVPPACHVLVELGGHRISRYWDFNPNTRVHYRTDREYEEHFRMVFGKAVKRRLRSDAPILSELSGGMDSSSIVCMADAIIAAGAAGTPRLDTVSYYDDTEPHWNERPYFTEVERRRGRIGCHIDIASRDPSEFKSDAERFPATPDSAGTLGPLAGRFAAYLTSQAGRVVLSGTGGDEVTGGVPNPAPELEDLLARARFRMLARQLKVWALTQRKPWLHLLFEGTKAFLPPDIVGLPKHKRPAPWLETNFVKRNRPALQGYEQRLKLFGALPSFQENMSTLESLRRQLATESLPCDPTYEKRYPYLDRTLLEFLYAIPREQLVRPGQRRSLMRRALVGIVPDVILNRRRKAYVVRGPLVDTLEHWSRLLEQSSSLISKSLGTVNEERVAEALEGARQGHEVPVVALMRTLGVETWLRKIRALETVALDKVVTNRHSSRNWIAQKTLREVVAKPVVVRHRTASTQDFFQTERR